MIDEEQLVPASQVSLLSINENTRISAARELDKCWALLDEIGVVAPRYSQIRAVNVPRAVQQIQDDVFMDGLGIKGVSICRREFMK